MAVGSWQYEETRKTQKFKNSRFKSSKQEVGRGEYERFKNSRVQKFKQEVGSKQLAVGNMKETSSEKFKNSKIQKFKGSKVQTRSWQ